jgi:hypothetical protein
MDDFSVASLSESKNEWCARLLNILTPTVIQGLKSIFDEAWKLCYDNKEADKYLMTFQNFLTRVPKWNQTIIDAEKTRIIETSGCTYIEELITAVHIIQLKALTCVRVGSKQKKIDIDVPSVSDFVHKIYIHVARKIYTNIYLYERNIAPLQTQKNAREVELIIKECILNTIRDSVPVESILRAYMDETEEQDVEVKEVVEPLPDEVSVPTTAKVTDASGNTIATASSTELKEAIKKEIEEYKKTADFTLPTSLSFSNDDTVVDTKGNTSIINSPKDEKNLAELEKTRALAASSSSLYGDDDGDGDDDDDDERLVIGENVSLTITDVNDLNKAASKVELKPPVLEFEVLT